MALCGAGFAPPLFAQVFDQLAPALPQAGGGGFLRSPGFDATGQPIPPTAPGFSALEAFGFPPSQLGGLPGGFSGRPFDIRASLGVSLLGTDNVRNTANDRRSDFAVTVLPGLQVSGDAAFIRGSLSYFPTASYYVNTPSQNRITHSFNGQALATLVEDRIFLDLRGSGAVLPTSGGFAPQGSVQVDQNNLVQSTSFQIAPYLVQQLGPIGTMNAGYAYRYSNQSGSNAFLPGATQPFFRPQSSQGNEVWLAIRSTEDLGRLALQLRLVGTVFSGTGVLNDAHRYLSTVQGAYALNRLVSLLGEIGYEDARYSGVQPYIVEDVVWGFGVRVTPDPDSVVVATYRQREGFTSAFLDASVALGVRTRLNANYNERLGIAGTQTIDILNTISYDAFGNPVDRFSGSPIVLPFEGTPLGPLGGPLLGGTTGFSASGGGTSLAIQNSVQKVRTASVSLSQLYERDTLSLQFIRQESTPVAFAAGIAAFDQKSWSIGFTWARLLREDTSLTGYVQYGRNDVAGSGESNTYVARAVLGHQISETIFSSLQYAYSNRGVGLGSERATQNLVIATLRKVF
jgi:uncharacterized protein (PEP-CTERM system associated)